ncbi:MAG: hypothetical protein HYT36_00490 [Candidatus Staskawiczbacteria bacterium]|nr:hypothetical protein [Candidatus Staskawiczbacteria bacterium]
MKIFSRRVILILAVFWLIFMAVFLFFYTQDKYFRELLKTNLEEWINKNKGRTKGDVKEEVFEPDLLKWRPVSFNVPFAKRDAHTLEVFKGKLWLLGGVGGESPDYTKNYSDIWYSENGKDWIQASSKAPWGPRRAHESVVFKDKIWIIGGVTTGERYLNDIWSSEDGINWVEVSNAAEFAPRKGFASVVFDNKIWVLGGVSVKGAENDVWVSENGRDWLLATEHASWPPRYDLAAEMFQNKFWVAGGIFPGETIARKDVWVSENGRDWTIVSEENAWPGRHGHCLLAFNDYLFIIGGWSGYAHGYNDAWYSKDGIYWRELYKDGLALWIGREDLTCAVFGDKILMLGGMETGGQRTNDVWGLGK